MSDAKSLIENTLLKTAPMSAKDLVEKIVPGGGPMTKKKINSILYDLLEADKVIRLEDTPPLWIKKTSELSVSQPSDDDRSGNSVQTLIFIDTTNSPCHRQAMRYANHDCLIWLYSKEQASLTIEENEYVKIQPLLQSNESISTAMILDIALFQRYHWGGNKSFFHIIVVSKSSAFQGFDKMLKQRMNIYEYQVDVDVITDGWDSLKLLLE